MKAISELETTFRRHGNPQQAEKMAAYMKNHFSFLGIMQPLRKELQKEFVDAHKKQNSEQAFPIIFKLWELDEREFQYVAMDLCKHLKGNKFREKDIDDIEKLLTSKSWWDSVDLLSSHVLGNFLLRFPEQTVDVVERFTYSGHLWLRRSTLLFQLNYKEVDKDLLYQQINRLRKDGDFFIQKAIGWCLRDLSRKDPAWVKQTVSDLKLEGLAKREALRLMR